MRFESFVRCQLIGIHINWKFSTGLFQLKNFYGTFSTEKFLLHFFNWNFFEIFRNFSELFENFWNFSKSFGSATRLKLFKIKKFFHGSTQLAESCRFTGSLVKFGKFWHELRSKTFDDKKRRFSKKRKKNGRNMDVGIFFDFYPV
jgi:hypothetical protein